MGAGAPARRRGVLDRSVRRASCRSDRATGSTQWRAQGWDPPNVIVNLGANDSGFCNVEPGVRPRSDHAPRRHDRTRPQDLVAADHAPVHAPRTAGHLEPGAPADRRRARRLLHVGLADGDGVGPVPVERRHAPRARGVPAALATDGRGVHRRHRRGDSRRRSTRRSPQAARGAERVRAARARADRRHPQRSSGATRRRRHAHGRSRRRRPGRHDRGRGQPDGDPTRRRRIPDRPPVRSCAARRVERQLPGRGRPRGDGGDPAVGRRDAVRVLRRGQPRDRRPPGRVRSLACRRRAPLPAAAARRRASPTRATPAGHRSSRSPCRAEPTRWP